jgi:hypothetical protein
MLARRSLLTLALTAGLGVASFRHDVSAAPNSITFQAKIGGKVHDSGSIAAAQTLQQSQPPVFNGCAIIKHQHTELGQYTYDIRVNPGSFLLGGWQKGAIDIMIANYRPNVATYTSPNIGGKFAFNGHAYGSSVVNSRVVIRDGGRSGTYTDRQAHKLEPDSISALTSTGNLTIQASWHCTSVLHLHDKY